MVLVTQLQWAITIYSAPAMFVIGY